MAKKDQKKFFGPSVSSKNYLDPLSPRKVFYQSLFTISRLFQNLEKNDPRCYGVNGLLEAYSVAQTKVELSGPTDFAPTIHFAARNAAAYPEDGSKYSVLLLLTDGFITDLEATKEEIVRVREEKSANLL